MRVRLLAYGSSGRMDGFPSASKAVPYCSSISLAEEGSGLFLVLLSRFRRVLLERADRPIPMHFSRCGVKRAAESDFLQIEHSTKAPLAS